MSLWPSKSGLWSHKIGCSLKSGQIYQKNYCCIQIVVFHERWSLNSGVSDDRFYCSQSTTPNSNHLTSSPQKFLKLEPIPISDQSVVDTKLHKTGSATMLQSYHLNNQYTKSLNSSSGCFVVLIERLLQPVFTLLRCAPAGLGL